MSANVIIQTAFLGDLLLSVPLLMHAKKIWPDEPLILICRSSLGGFIKELQLVDEVYEIKKGDSESYRQVIKTLRSTSIHRVIAPHESLRTAFFCFQMKSLEKISFSKWWSFIFFNKTIQRNETLPDAIRQLSLLSIYDSHLKQQIGEYQNLHSSYSLDSHQRLSSPPQWASMNIRERIQASSQQWLRTVCLFPGSVWATKKWTEEGFIQLGKKIAKDGYQIVVMGGRGEEVLCQNIHDQISGSLNMCGKTTLYESLQIMQQSLLVIGNDSGSAHMASLLGVPTITIFGPTILEFGFRPWSDQSYIIQNKNIQCRPCGPHGHHQCPIGTHECMTQISAEEVYNKARELLMR